MSAAHHTTGSLDVTALADNVEARRELACVIRSMRFRLLAEGSTADADVPFGDVISIDVRPFEAADAEARLSAVTARLGRAQCVLVQASLANLDAALAACPDAEMVVGDDEAELRLSLAAVAARVGGRPTMLNDVTSDEGLRLQHLADEIARIARTLVELPQGLTEADIWSDAQIDYRAPPEEGAEITATEVRRIIRLRRLRDRFFSAELFADPAWDMLLDLSAARLERTRVAVSSLCIAAAVPPTTALRWIKAMTDRGLLRRIADIHDARRVFVDLSDDAAAAMSRYLRLVRANGGVSL